MAGMMSTRVEAAGVRGAAGRAGAVVVMAISRKKKAGGKVRK
jgi:hypothetical protein